MTPIKEAAGRFLSIERIAVTGVSRTPGSRGGNIVYNRLRERGYQVFAVNPNADEVEGDPCYHDLGSIPGGVEAVVIASAPVAADAAMRECIDLGIPQVWMHRSFGAGSVSTTAADLGREHGVTVIDGGCPLMFEPTSDPAHRLLKHVCTWTRKAPRTV